MLIYFWWTYCHSLRDQLVDQDQHNQHPWKTPLYKRQEIEIFTHGFNSKTRKPKCWFEHIYSVLCNFSKMYFLFSFSKKKVICVIGLWPPIIRANIKLQVLQPHNDSKQCDCVSPHIQPKSSCLAMQAHHILAEWQCWHVYVYWKYAFRLMENGNLL